jgi:hypothetical protein
MIALLTQIYPKFVNLTMPFQLFKADMAAIGLTPRGAVAAEDIRHLQRRPGHAS